jgi:uncharacterized damage-inducible protein DinB
MSAKAEVLKEEFEFVFARLEETLEGIGDKEFTYRLTEVSNDIQSILNHLSRETNLQIPRIIKGDLDYTPENWPDEYVEHSYSLEKLMGDISRGREKVLEGVAGLSEKQLEEEIPLMAGTYPRKIGLYAYVGELFHHRGQIAFIRGTVKRLRERDPDFLK